MLCLFTKCNANFFCFLDKLFAQKFFFKNTFFQWPNHYSNPNLLVCYRRNFLPGDWSGSWGWIPWSGWSGGYFPGVSRYSRPWPHPLEPAGWFEAPRDPGRSFEAATCYDVSQWHPGAWTVCERACDRSCSLCTNDQNTDPFASEKEILKIHFRLGKINFGLEPNTF